MQTLEKEDVKALPGTCPEPPGTPPEPTIAETTEWVFYPGRAILAGQLRTLLQIKAGAE